MPRDNIPTIEELEARLARLNEPIGGGAAAGAGAGVNAGPSVNGFVLPSVPSGPFISNPSVGASSHYHTPSWSSSVGYQPSYSISSGYQQPTMVGNPSVYASSNGYIYGAGGGYLPQSNPYGFGGYYGAQGYGQPAQQYVYSGYGGQTFYQSPSYEHAPTCPSYGYGGSANLGYIPSVGYVYYYM